MQDEVRANMVAALSEWTAANPDFDGYLPTRGEKERLALSCGAPVKNIEYWFWGRNQKLRKAGAVFGEIPSALLGTGHRKKVADAPAFQRSKGSQGRHSRCSACGQNGSIVAHPLLQTSVCQNCVNRCRAFTSGSSGAAGRAMRGCSWCGGAAPSGITSCGHCDVEFCKNCIVRNFSIQRWTEIREIKAPASWECFVCDPSPLKNVPRIGASVSVDFDDDASEEDSTGVICRLGKNPGQFYVKYTGEHTEEYLVDPAQNHVFSAYQKRKGAPKPKTKPATEAKIKRARTAKSKAPDVIKSPVATTPAPVPAPAATEKKAEKKAAAAAEKKAAAAAAAPAPAAAEKKAALDERRIRLTFGKDKLVLTAADLSKVHSKAGVCPVLLEKMLRKELQVRIPAVAPD
jgi:hypothetical protein